MEVVDELPFQWNFPTIHTLLLILHILEMFCSMLDWKYDLKEVGILFIEIK